MVDTRTAEGRMDTTEAVAVQRARGDALRAGLVTRYGLTAQDDAAAAALHAGHPTPDAAGLLSVTVEGRLGYPGFQFTGDHVRPGWAGLIQPLRVAGWGDDEIALWLAAPTGWLNGRRPADLLGTDPDSVRNAIACVCQPAGT